MFLRDNWLSVWLIETVNMRFPLARLESRGMKRSGFIMHCSTMLQTLRGRPFSKSVKNYRPFDSSSVAIRQHLFGCQKDFFLFKFHFILFPLKIPTQLVTRPQMVLCPRARFLEKRNAAKSSEHPAGRSSHMARNTPQEH